MSHEKYQSCIQACNDCATECEHCSTACLHEEDVKMMAVCIEFDRYCADACRMAAAFMARADENTLSLVQKFYGTCADFCNACGTECEKHSHMEHCKRCAEACRKCADECRKMAA